MGEGASRHGASRERGRLPRLPRPPRPPRSGVRRPCQESAERGWLTPVGDAGGSEPLPELTGPGPTRAPKPNLPGPGRPPGSKKRQPATHYDVGQAKGTAPPARSGRELVSAPLPDGMGGTDGSCYGDGPAAASLAAADVGHRMGRSASSRIPGARGAPPARTTAVGVGPVRWLVVKAASGRWIPEPVRIRPATLCCWFVSGAGLREWAGPWSGLTSFSVGASGSGVVLGGVVGGVACVVQSGAGLPAQPGVGRVVVVALVPCEVDGDDGHVQR